MAKRGPKPDPELKAFIENLTRVYALERCEAVLLKALVKAKGNVSKACPIARISRLTYYEWLKHNSYFKAAVLEVDQFLDDRAEETWAIACENDWQAAKAFLERRRPERWNKNIIEQRSLQAPGEDGPPTQINYIRGETPEVFQIPEGQGDADADE